MNRGGWPAFAVVGSGRSGSRYIASVLTACGLTCGHEAYWNPGGRTISGLLGDSSWCALRNIDLYDGRVFHQVRHPLDVVSSLVEVPTHGDYRDLHDKLIRGLPAADGLERAVAVYVGLNDLAEKHTELTWQVERVTAELLVDIGARLSVPVAWASAALAVASVPPTLNQHAARRSVDWDDLPFKSVWTDRLLDMAACYGYLES